MESNSYTYVCKFCKQEYITKNKKKRHYCSDECRKKSKERVCPTCGIEFIANTSNKLYCSKECFDNSPNNAEIRTCLVCNQEFEISKFKQAKCCSEECSTKCREQNKRKNNLEKYGVENVYQIKEIQEKSQKTRVKNLQAQYGEHITNVSQLKEVREKIEKTIKRKYGDEFTNISQVPEFKDKISKGISESLKSEEIQNKIKATMIEKYGADNTLKVPEIRQKIINSTAKNRGYTEEFTNVSQIPEIRKKMNETLSKVMSSQEIQAKSRKTNLERYGAEFYLVSKDCKEKTQATYIKRYGTKINSVAYLRRKNVKDWAEMDKFLIKNSKKYNCLELCEYFDCGYAILRGRVKYLELEKHINGFYSYSKPELLFKDLITKFGLKEFEDYFPHYRKLITPLEVDFYFPKINLAVEISPMFTHNADRIEDKYYHFNKFQKCLEKDVELITIFDWHDLDKIIDFILSKFENKNRIYARNCTLKVTNEYSKIHREFLRENHILGDYKGKSIVHELYFDNTLVGIATFVEKEREIELKRLAFKDNLIIVGGASKLIKPILSKTLKDCPLITFSDNDLGSGSVYEKIGFEKIGMNKGQLNWFNEEYGVRINNLSLVKQGADRLLKNFPNYQVVGMGKDLPSNQEIIQMYGFVPIYDCGYTKWRYKIR